jgi:hypothetical protein
MRTLFAIGEFVAAAGACHMQLAHVPYGLAAVVWGMLLATWSLTEAA